MDPMPSGAGRSNRRWTQMNADARRDRRGSSMWPPICDTASATTWDRPYRRNTIQAINPMPSGGAGAGEERAHAAELGAGGAAEGGDLGRAGAVLPAGPAAAGEAGHRARAGAEAAVETAAAVAHGRLAAFAAAAGAGAAAGCGEEIAGGVTVLQPATVGGREQRRIGAINPMSGGT